MGVNPPKLCVDPKTIRFEEVTAGELGLAQALSCGQIAPGLKPGETLPVDKILAPAEHQAYMRFLSKRRPIANASSPMEVEESARKIAYFVNPFLDPKNRGRLQPNNPDHRTDHDGDGAISYDELKTKIVEEEGITDPNDPSLRLKIGLRAQQIRASQFMHGVPEMETEKPPGPATPPERPFEQPWLRRPAGAAGMTLGAGLCWFTIRNLWWGLLALGQWVAPTRMTALHLAPKKPWMWRGLWGAVRYVVPRVAVTAGVGGLIFGALMLADSVIRWSQGKDGEGFLKPFAKRILDPLAKRVFGG